MSIRKIPHKIPRIFFIFETNLHTINDDVTFFVEPTLEGTRVVSRLTNFWDSLVRIFAAASTILQQDICSSA